ncbi:hypothetical protein BDN67DRAFT_963989 [Paxillus ammoniavirescens]|nr:hypothetical protein BDN67DRAFT_963989 [Paxillus ammoniavirescens]
MSPRSATWVRLKSSKRSPAQYTRAAALRRHVPMLENDRDVDYFLFDDKVGPIRIVIDGLAAKVHPQDSYC